MQEITQMEIMGTFGQSCHKDIHDDTINCTYKKSDGSCCVIVGLIVSESYKNKLLPERPFPKLLDD